MSKLFNTTSRQHEIYQNGETIPPMPNEELIEQHKIGTTPFTAVGNKERGYFLALGRYKLSQEFKHPDEVEEYLFNKETMLDVIMNVIQIFIDNNKTQITENP